MKKHAYECSNLHFFHHCDILAVIVRSYKEQEFFFLFEHVCWFVDQWGLFVSSFFIFYFLHLSVHSYVMMSDDPKRHNILRSKKQKKKREIQFIATTKSRGPTQYKTKTWSKNSHTPCQHGPLYLGACKLKQVWQLRIAYHMWHESAQQLFQNKTRRNNSATSPPVPSLHVHCKVNS